MRVTDITILGGGWAGLLCGYELAKKFPHAIITILERSDKRHLGGLLKSENIEGFTFDTGGPHILFSKNRDILNKIIAFLGENVKKIERNAFVYYNDKYVPYPFENGIYVLEPSLRAKIGEDIIQAMLTNAANPTWIPSTFRDWIYGFFGNTMGSEYLEPYNRKIWKTDPSNMEASWVFSPGRLPFPELKEILSSVAGLKSVGYQEQQYFYYPKVGGIKALYDSLLTKVIELGVEFVSSYKVTSVVKTGDYWTVNGDIVSKDIINTLPLTVLPNILEIPEKVSGLIGNLIYTKDIVVGVAINRPNPDAQVLYVPSTDINFHRLTWMSNLAEAPFPNTSNLIAETTISGQTIPDLNEITKKTLDGLIKMKIIVTEEDVIFTKTWINDYGYPVYDLDHERIRGGIFSYLDSIGIKSVGRWGSWHYWNTDMVYKAVLETVKSVSL